jgi:hypothetical protein
MLYKFLSPERIDVLQTLKIRFSQPNALNDPFESAVLVDAGNFIDIEDKLLEIAKDFSAEDDEDRAFIDSEMDKMRKHAADQMTSQVVGRRLMEYMNRAQGVLSLSRVNDNLLMWAHYCDSHRGFVLGLDETHGWFRGLNQFGKYTQPLNVIYTSKRPTFKTGTDDFHERLQCHKSIDWAYEEEVRIFRAFGDTKEQIDSHNPMKLHLFDLPRDCIKEVFIGANAGKELREKILQAVNKHRLSAKIYEAFNDDERFEINFRPVDPIPDYTQR